MKYEGTRIESDYKNALRLFEAAKDFNDINAKTSYLRQAWNAAFELPNDYPGRDKLMDNIENYASGCKIDLGN